MTASEQSPTTSVRALRPPGEPGALVLVISGSIGRTHIHGLCHLVRVLLEAGDADIVVCDVGAIVDPDAAAIDALARLQLIARQFGGQVRLRYPCGELQELLSLMGLNDVLPLCAELPIEPSGKLKRRSQPSGVEERDR